MRKKINKTLALLMAFALCFSSVNIQAFAQVANDTEQAVVNTTEEIAESEASTEAMTEKTTETSEQELSTQTQETTEDEQTTDVEEVSTEVEETVSEEVSTEVETVIDSSTETGTEETTVTETNNWDGVTTENIYEADNYKVTFTLASYWDIGYNANIKIENTGDIVIQNWYLNLDFDSEITNIWNAEISEESKENSYTIKNAGWNQDIAVGGAVEFGISGNEAFKGFPDSYKLTGINTEVNTDDYNITYSIESDWGSGFTGSIVITNNTDATLEDWVLEFDFDREITEIWNGVIEEHEGNHYVIRNTEYNSNIATGATVSVGFKGGAAGEMTEPENYKLYSYKANDAETEEETDRGKDTDSDRIPDYIEEAFGTDTGKADTDGDDLSDYVEILSLVLNPCLPDTDGDGVTDSNEDTDSDGLTNIEEINQGTILTDDDTDNDDLNDGDEVYKYKTKPCCDDTDGDGALDGKEIELGTNPLVADETFDISMESDDEDTVKASVSIGLSGEQIDTLSVEEFENDFLFPENMPGYIGSAYDFTVEGSFESAIISFEFNESLLSTPDFEPVIYYFNEEEQVLEELETTVTGNVASARVTHFSKYILLNKGETNTAYAWHDVWGSEDTTNTGVEIVFVIDNSGSMSSNDSTGQRLTVVQNLIDKLSANSKIGIIRFTASATKLTSALTDNKEYAKSFLSTTYFKPAGNTNMYTAIDSAFTMFESEADDILKMVVVLSDGVSSGTYRQQNIISTAQEMGVKIYTVGLGSSTGYFNNYLKPLAEETSGVFYTASDADQLSLIYDDIRQKIDITTDSDGDGLPDYYEDNLQMFNGLTMQLDKNDTDSDDDGLEDGKEVSLKYEYSDDKTQVKVRGKFFSNPEKADTDGDGLDDYAETYCYDSKALFYDTDRDGLDDGTEVALWFPENCIDYDGDGRGDWQEYKEGTSPYVYDKSRDEYLAEFRDGFFGGEFFEDTDSVACILGKIVSGFTPVGNVRDMIADVIQGDWLDAGINAAGIIFDGADVTKTVGKISKFLKNNAKNTALYAEILSFLNKNFPETLEYLGKNDEFIEVTKKISLEKEDKITKKQHDELKEILDKIGLDDVVFEEDNNELLHVYRGTNLAAETEAYSFTNHLMSEALLRAYIESGYNLDEAYNIANLTHKQWLDIFGDELNYAEAHGRLGQELPKKYNMDRTLISVTTDIEIAKYYATSEGTIYEAYIPKSELIKQPLSSSNESEFLIRVGSGDFTIWK